MSQSPPRSLRPGAGGSRTPESEHTNHGRLSERYIQDAFHRYLKSSLTQARVERLLDVDVLSSAEGDLMVAGPALCLYFAALRCTTDPPSVPLPRSLTSMAASKSTSSSTRSPTTPGNQPQNPNLELSQDNCPPTFISYLRVWAHAVPRIQALTPELQHDLARVICGLSPLSASSASSGSPSIQPPPALPPHLLPTSHSRAHSRTSSSSSSSTSNTHIPPLHKIESIAADLRAVAIEISQRRSFQDRFASDLQAALDYSDGFGGTAGSGVGRGDNSNDTNGRKLRASFVPPPVYSEDAHAQAYQPELKFNGDVQPTSPKSPSLFFDTNINTNDTSVEPLPHLLIIRETLYATLASVLESQPSLPALLRTDPPRAYFASVAFAVLAIASSSSTSSSNSASGPHPGTLDTSKGTLTGVLGHTITLDTCPAELRPFLAELLDIGREVEEVEKKDFEEVVWRVERGLDVDDSSDASGGLGVTRMEQVRRMLEGGVGYAYAPTDTEGRRGEQGEERRIHTRASPRGRTVSLVNRINALSLGMTRLRAFRERQEEVFGILVAVTRK